MPPFHCRDTECPVLGAAPDLLIMLLFFPKVQKEKKNENVNLELC